MESKLCIVENSENLDAVCENYGLEDKFDYIEFYKKYDENSVMELYKRVRDLV